MSNNKQSSIDILCGKLAMKLGIPQAITFYIDHQEEIAEAKAMHKEEICQFVSDYLDDAADDMVAEEYYDQIYGGKNE